jgi:hypothetical protein
LKLAAKERKKRKAKKLEIAVVSRLCGPLQRALTDLEQKSGLGEPQQQVRKRYGIAVSESVP